MENNRNGHRWLVFATLIGAAFGLATGGGCGGSGGTAGMGGMAGTAGAGGGAAGAGGGVAGAGGTGPCVETDARASIAMACDDCLLAMQNPVTDGCCKITGDPLALDLCQAASACMRSGTVTAPGADPVPCNAGGDTGTCYCGTSSATCISGGANGPCVAQIIAAAGRNWVTGVTDAPMAATIIQRYGDPDYALGRAANIQAVAGAFCASECGF